MAPVSLPPEHPGSKEEESPIHLVVPESKKGLRVDLFLLETGRFSSRHQIQRLIQKGSVRVNRISIKPSYRLKPHDEIVVEIPPPDPDPTRPDPIPLHIIHEDHDLLVVNKPAGMVVHPAAGHRRNTLVNALLFHCEDLSGIGGTLRPGIVHRLDKGTSGLLVVAKSDSVHLALSKQFQARSTLREYLGLVHGTPGSDRGREDAPIGRHPKDRKRMSAQTRRGRHAITDWKVERYYHGFSLMRFTLKTGRTHQIRVHITAKGHPIVGDTVYGGRRVRSFPASLSERGKETLKGMNRLFLHAEKLGFEHPKTRCFLCFSAPLPSELTELLEVLDPLESK